MYTLSENLCIQYNSTENENSAISHLEDRDNFDDTVMPENENTQHFDFHTFLFTDTSPGKS